MTTDWAIYRYVPHGRLIYVTRVQCDGAELDALKIVAEAHGETLIARPYWGSARPPMDGETIIKQDGLNHGRDTRSRQ